MNHPVSNPLIDRSAIPSYLSTGSGEGAYVPHLDHSIREVREESRGVCAVGPHYCVGCAAIKELLIRVQKAPPVQEVCVICIVESRGSGDVQIRQIVIIR